MKKKNISTMHGVNKRLDEIHASILNLKLKYLKYFNSKRIRLANKYLKNFINKNIILPKKDIQKTHVYHLFVIKVPANKRNKIIDFF